METRHSPKNSQELVPIGKAASALGVAVETVRRWEKDGKITAYRTPGGQRRFDLAEIEKVKSGDQE